MTYLVGQCKIIKDSKGSDYLAIDISNHDAILYENFMLNNHFNEEVNLKNERDHGQYHITLINTMQWGSLTKKGISQEIIDNFVNKRFSFEVFGIGKAEKDNNYAYFVILENEELTKMRNTYNLSPHDFHMTLGFKNKDVFGVPKNRSSCVFTNEQIYSNSSKLKPKI